jgi:hypothetical protein
MHAQVDGFLEKPAVEEIVKSLKAEHLSLVGWNEIWLCDSEGNNPVRLTSMEAADTGSPGGRPMAGSWFSLN